jgi:hypothetical protein
MAQTERKLMKVATMLFIAAAAVVLTSAALASDYDELAAEGYRWVSVDGPYGCPSKDDLRQITKTARTKWNYTWWNNYGPTTLSQEL